MRVDLADKLALVTGGAGGIGSATARLLVEAGARVVAMDRLERMPASLANLPLEYRQLDVTDELAWAELVMAVDAEHGRIDMLVNAAGIEGDQGRNTIASTTLEDWRRVHAINLDGTFLGCRSVMPVMERAGHGAIVNVSSVASYFPMPFNCAYGSSKAAVQHLTRSVAAWGSRNGHRIRCNSVHPGLVRTDMLRSIAAAGALRDGLSADAAIDQHARSAIPLGRAAEPEDVARQILYLSSDLAGQVTGADFRIDGGWTLAAGGWQRRLALLDGPPSTS